MSQSIGVGVIGIFAATAAAVFAPSSIEDLFLIAGVGSYYLGVVGYLFIWQRTGVRLLDEREARIEQKTGQIVVSVLIAITIFALPADVLLDTTGIVDVPPAIRGVVWGYALLLLFSLLVYGYVADRMQ
ncbi:hypothetical protein AUR64_11710 [Haloprofundus marisrubri]|uniref:DUF2178 domain-containing protein n=2 Tax=Haloprofundus marisrubri TaxID=1514971 RepID=A0A0W1RB36_9EURY|nr:hypothetical protein AUR64_11710 [Haloprofundus marisrubri]